ncbi:hypothetical protein VH86_13555 [Pantoea sp. BL1]|uniref:hypothetical protein n=1 Tax=Erwiniaceae TaxID=1903409 RepID=UPI0005F87277|nr:MULTISPECIES: hypothetical protein [Erwiniaceae]KJV47874.1 hypothetical protein VH86_13555 [Pantoea sp. BL1]MBK0091324.1 hypothetical protein [Erwinia sp. S59]MBK0122342.1 hypothetical protein [Pantoea sp. S61]MBK0122949.1 hypothetical protein [Pantoea sp. S61]
MKILIFFIILIAGIVLIPDGLISHLVSVSGDGETAMDKYDFTLLLIKAAISAIIALAVLQIVRRAR